MGAKIKRDESLEIGISDTVCPVGRPRKKDSASLNTSHMETREAREGK